MTLGFGMYTIALWMLTRQCLFDLDLLYDKVKCVSECILYGDDFSVTVEAKFSHNTVYNSHQIILINETMAISSHQRSWLTFNLLAKVALIEFQKHFFLRNQMANLTSNFIWSELVWDETTLI